MNSVATVIVFSYKVIFLSKLHVICLFDYYRKWWSWLLKLLYELLWFHLYSDSLTSPVAGKRPRDLLNPKAIKYMQSVFSIKDSINKKETREISALFGVTVTQVCSFSIWVIHSPFHLAIILFKLLYVSECLTISHLIGFLGLNWVRIIDQ